jgi:hypothetical protein
MMTAVGRVQTGRDVEKAGNPGTLGNFVHITIILHLRIVDREPGPSSEKKIRDESVRTLQ